MIYTIKNALRGCSKRGGLYRVIYLTLNRLKTRLFFKVSDRKFAIIKYRENTGMKLNLDNPKNFNEKLWWLKLNNKDPLLTECSDKVRVRGYVARSGLSKILSTVEGVYNDPDDIEFDKLKGRFFIKCNHGSGANIVYDSGEYFDRKRFVKMFKLALKNNYYYQSREWNYKNIAPKILVENFINSPNGLVDYRFLCFDGRVKLVFVDIETAAADGEHNPYARRNVYNSKFELQDFTVGRVAYDPALVEKPHNFHEMIDIAEKLSAPFIFCRVDLYNIEGAIKFGEITFYPGGATQGISSKEWDVKMGSWIDLNSDKIKL